MHAQRAQIMLDAIRHHFGSGTVRIIKVGESRFVKQCRLASGHGINGVACFIHFLLLL
jgi:hypothetical protein